jgi:arylsulfatase A-like enzyme
MTGMAKWTWACAAAALATISFVALYVAGLITPARAEEASRPNIVVILADDLGHNDLSATGSTLVKTPNIDSIARDGARFQNGYSGDAVCSTSRAALLTGRSSSRFGFEFLPGLPGYKDALSGKGEYAKPKYPNMDTGVDNVALVPANQRGLPATELTLGDLLRTQGYHTGIIGKWHVGGAPNFHPTKHGFDEFIGFLGGAALYGRVDDPAIVTFKQTWVAADAFIFNTLDNSYAINGKPAKASYMTYDLANAAVDYIDRNKKKPFFLYLAFNAPHVPEQAPKAVYDKMDYIKDPGMRTHYAQIAALDQGVGQVLAKLKAEGLDKNTIVVFTSDNGGPDYDRIPYENLPYRGWKLTYFEGGFNVPYFIRWPGHVKPGTMVRGSASSLDLAPTLVKAAGGHLPTDREYDGVDLAPAISGREPDALINRTFYWRKEDYRAVRDGDWKLQTSKYPQKTWLFNLKIDPTERFNVAAQHPDKVKELAALYAEHEKKFRAPIWPAGERLRVDIDGWTPEQLDDIDYIFWAN